MTQGAPQIIAGGTGAAVRLREELKQSLRSLLPQASNQSVTLVINNAQGEMIAGISGATSYGWLHIELLWVAEGHRQQGLARSLLAAAEAQAHAIGCHDVWLETSNPAARSCYKKLGYVEFGVLANQDGHELPDHRRWFFRKAIDTP
ncbi:MAG: GNAT family N-acetyltransferase [Pseudomonadota bacterium]